MSAIFGEQLTFAQENGSEVRLFVFGDEFYARYENDEGYTVIYDSDLGLFCYALVLDGKFVSSGVPISQEPPPGLRRHVEESEEVRHAIYVANRLASLPPPNPPSQRDTFRTLGPNAGLLTGRRLSTGSVRGLTVLVEFQDVSSTVTQADVAEMLNGANFTRNGNFCSVREYYRLMSSGKLDYTNVVVGPFKLSHDRMYYTTHLLVEEALTLAIAGGVDLTQFDSRNEGIIDSLNFLYAGQTQYLDQLWPHNSFLNLQFGNIRTNLYLLTSLGRTSADLSIGTFCHENGHLLCRFPDMYDYGNRDGDGVESAGIGAYCLMGSGNHLNRGRTPSPVCGYLRELAGWCDNVVILDHSGQFEAIHGDYATVFKAETDKPNEYFIVENRSKLGLDTSLPSSGLAVYHCDTKGSNEWQEGSATRHYQCALLQADGHFDLEHNLNQGDGTDLFQAISGVALSDSTNPSSRQWDGADSGLVLSGISGPDATIAFTVGVEASLQVVHGEAVPSIKIPDNNTDGVESVIEISQMGTAQQVKVNVDITHSYIGDLVVELTSPQGQSISLHSRTGASRDDLITTYDSALVPALAALIGKPVQGKWTLHVKDVARQDIGKFNRWSLDVGVKASEAISIVRRESSPDLKIPDDDLVGVSSAIEIDQPGTAKQVKVTIDITHTYIGDLRVELVSPTGRTAVLQSRLGGGQDNLVSTHDSTTPSSALTPLVGQPLQGKWVLRVADLAGKDIGTLNKWSLELTPGD